MSHFTWLNLLGIPHEYINVGLAVIAALLIITMSVTARLVIGTGEVAILPAAKLSLKGIFEMLVEFIAGLLRLVLGQAINVYPYIPIFGSIFIYIFVNNVIGLLPGMSSASQDINLGLAVGLFSFVLYNFMGFKESGLAYFKHFLGPVALLAPLLLVIELVSNLLRPLTLGLRLSANMSGDHTVLGIFLDLVPIGVPVIFYGMGLFVCFMQAFVFTLLSIIYVMLATAHDH